MKNAGDYLAHIKALIALNRQVVHWMVVREEAQGDMGLFRYRLTLRDGGLLEMFERFQVIEERLWVTRYSFHWQAVDGQLRKRWDNAAHPSGDFDTPAPRSRWCGGQCAAARTDQRRRSAGDHRGGSS